VLSLLPTLASGAIVQKWQASSLYALVAQVGDINDDGVYDLVTVEASTLKVALRSGTTGALVAQSAGAYAPAEELWIQNVDADNDAEIIFNDVNTGNLVCLQYNGTSTLAVRWNYKPTPNGVPPTWEFADLDGNGQLYLVFKDEVDFTKWYVRDNNGVLVSTITLAAAPSGAGWVRDVSVDDYDFDGRQEILIDYHHVGTFAPDAVYVYESNAPAAPGIATDVSTRRTYGEPFKFGAKASMAVEPPSRLTPVPAATARAGQ
jgi:hypothetical protein